MSETAREVRARLREAKASVELVTLRGLGYLLIDQTSMSQESGA